MKASRKTLGSGIVAEHLIARLWELDEFLSLYIKGRALRMKEMRAVGQEPKIIELDLVACNLHKAKPWAGLREARRKVGAIVEVARRT